MTGAPAPGVTFVHGWLDSGADELAIRLAQAAGPGAVLVHHSHEPPTTPPDVERIETHETIGYRTQGCACCAQRVDLVDVLGRIARRRDPPAHIIVLELPGADPATSVATVLDDPDLTRHVRLNAVALALDGPATATAMGDGAVDPWPSLHLLDATILADSVWISRSRQLTRYGIRLASFATRQLNPLASIAATSEPGVDHVLSSTSWSPRGIRTRLHQVTADDGAAAYHTARPPVLTGSMTLGIEGSLDPDRLNEWIRALHGASGARLLRIEAELAIAGSNRPVLVTGCRTTVRRERGAPWPDGEPRRSRLRIAGRQLELGDLASELLACRA